MTNPKTLWDSLPKCGRNPDLARRELVSELYLQGLSCRQVGELIGVSAQNVHQLLQQHKTPTRPRGGNTGSHSRHRRR